ncbi:MAG: hypothetical protein SH818_13565 [Saprospiraceae bacterium]|nr:hypothetical protein [Saprospiraceae bacterium]
MKTGLLMLMVSLLGISCQKDASSDPEILEGNYVTSPLLDFRCIALNPDQLPTLTVSRLTLNSFAVSVKTVFPEKRTLLLQDITLDQVQDGFMLIYKNQPAGSWKNVSYLDNKKILNISVATPDEFIYFVGEKD